jgi:uncharacterized membrane protein YfcA
MLQRSRRAHALGLVSFFSAFLMVSGSAWASYAGQSLLQWAASYIIAPLGIISVVVGLGAAIFRPEHVTKAIYSAVICVVIYFVISAGDTLVAAMKSGS